MIRGLERGIGLEKIEEIMNESGRVHQCEPTEIEVMLNERREGVIQLESREEELNASSRGTGMVATALALVTPFSLRDIL